MEKPSLNLFIKHLLWLLPVFIGWRCWGQTTLEHRVFLLGNTADLTIDSPLYAQLGALIEGNTSGTTVILNGDFSTGQADEYEDSIRIRHLLASLSSNNNVRTILIPGDRDWAHSQKNGWEQVRNLEKMVHSMNFPNVIWAIKKGCPGPEEIWLDENTLLINMQTQWWNHPHQKPQPAGADCKFATEDVFIEELEDLIEENAQKNILLAGHYPLISYGPYGGKWPLKNYLLPIPIFSGLIPSFHANVGAAKDIANDNFDDFRNLLEQVSLEQNGLIYVSGHEHNLQILSIKDHYLINSGSPTKPSYSGKGELALYAESQPGLIELRYFDHGKVQAVVHKVDHSGMVKLKELILYRSFCETDLAPIPYNSRYAPCNQLNDTSGSISKKATVTVAAGLEYEAGKFKQRWLGKHYRGSWTTPVKVPYLDLESTFGGLLPYQKGGGRQTTSLKFKAQNGEEYVFRSVNKDPTKALDYEFRKTVVGTVVRDQTSAQQPFGAMAVDVLLDKLNILHAHPKLYVLPDDPALGQFRGSFAGLMGMLEERPTNPKKVEKPFAQAQAILKSNKMFRELYDDHDNKVNIQEFARARVFDMWVGDWGKHEDNWKWAGYADHSGMTYRPVPRDRDHVFSLWDGLLPWLADREWAKESAANFGYEFKGIRSLMWQARHLDRLLGNQLTREDWRQAAREIQQNINKEDIDRAVNNMPAEIYEVDGRTIASKLERRLNQLPEAVSQYYDLLAREVDVVGSNKREFFEIIRAKDGSVSVAMFDLDKKSGGADSSRRYYHRRFIPEETKEIRVFGLRKADHFHISGQARKSIPIRIIGGPGADQVSDSSKVGGLNKATKVYENDADARLYLGTEARLVKHWNNQVFNYDRTAFAYNTYLPLAFISFSKDFGFGLRTGLQFTRQKYGKKDFASKHSLGLTLSTENIKVLSYDARFHHVWGRWDVILSALAGNHYYFTFFFGIGNDTQKDDKLFDQDYYRTNYNSNQLSVGVLHEFWEGNNSHLAFKLHYENNSQQINENTILTDTQNPMDILGINDINLLESVFDLELDFRDRSSLPERGMRVALKHQSGIITNESNDGYGVTQGFLEGFMSTNLRRPLTFGIRLGGSKSYGEIPFYKLKYLGQRNDLRGYLRNRFTGESTLFINTEMRWELYEFHTSLFPLRFGVKAFYDAGRVYSKFDETDNWHQGYGGGIYLVPLLEQFSINLSVAFSEEESGLFLLGIGKAF